MSRTLEGVCRDPFTAQLMALIAEQPGINTRQLTARLNPQKDKTGQYLTVLKQAGLLKALVPHISNQPYGWALAGYQAPRVEPEPVIAPEPVITPEPVIEDEDEDDDEEISFNRARPHSASLPKGITEEDLEWHRYWQSRALQRVHRTAPLETA